MIINTIIPPTAPPAATGIILIALSLLSTKIKTISNHFVNIIVPAIDSVGVTELINFSDTVVEVKGNVNIIYDG